MNETAPEGRPVIIATEFSFLRDCWCYALSDGRLVFGRPGDARVPAGLTLTERMQWAVNRIYGRH